MDFEKMTLQDVVEMCIKEGMELNIAAHAKGIVVKLRHAGPVNYGASTEAGLGEVRKALIASYKSLKNALGKR